MSKMSAIEDLLKTIERLRAPGGCPWDREQTHKSICNCLVEETAEFIETVDLGEREHMCEELGDLLLQVIMHAQIAKEEGAFTFDDVARVVNEKMVRRHPHVFGDISLKDSDAVLKKWDEIKSGEKSTEPKKKTSEIFKDVPPTLDSVLKATATWKSVEKKSLNPGTTVDRTKIDALAKELTEETAGKMLFEIIAACRQAKIDPDSALRRQTLKTIAECEKNAGSAKA